jgi:glycogen debranching enzyme
MDGLVARNMLAEGTALARPSTTILAGNQYFHDSWKRDENIALGFLLSLGFYDLAREVIRDTWQLQDETTGRLPQRIRAGEEPPYHSSDGTLWALIRLYQYWRCSGDMSLLIEKRLMVERFFERSLDRLVDDMLPSGRMTHPDYLWETWMDTPHTPRDGFPIEIQLLWLAVLRQYRPVIGPENPELEARMARAEAGAWEALRRFDVGGVLADSLDEYGTPRELITPNAYFAFGLGLDLGPQLERAMRQAGRAQLAGSHGIRTLAPNHWDRVFPPEFLADARNIRGRRMRSIGKFNYHRGVEWNWLARFFVEAELKFGDPETAFHRYLRPQVRSVLARDGIGGISELHDLSGARGPEYQSWSMSGFLEALHAFAAVKVDVPAGAISIEPQLPPEWPRLQLRKWYGTIPFDLTYSMVQGAPLLEIQFPWGETPDARLDITFVLPPRTTVEYIEAHLGSTPCMIPWQTERVSGSLRRRVRVSIQAHEHVTLSVGVRKQEARLGETA